MIVVLDFPTQAKKKSVAIWDLHKIWQNFPDAQTRRRLLLFMLIGPRQEPQDHKVSIVCEKVAKKFSIFDPLTRTKYKIQCMYLELYSDSFLFRIALTFERTFIYYYVFQYFHDFKNFQHMIN